MTEEEARERTREIVGPAAMARLEQLAGLVQAENERQNLIARSTVEALWSRHILDSAQLLLWADAGKGLWLDIGTGGGFPGLVIAAATDCEIVLSEPRRLRAAFLTYAAASLGLKRCRVAAVRVEQLSERAVHISARAVAPVEKLLQASAHCATADARWLLLRGRLTPEEQSSFDSSPDTMFHVEQSLTDPASSVVIARRGGRS